ncbi:MAG: 2,3-bisphosphoglycerate-independent phosphoglycerate mutase [Desulfobacteraceae bacterium]|nr:2,3-bisphosphoglycerate-independent phosphoglycerate mutase [Desulfobacteraceae bacterium]
MTEPAPVLLAILDGWGAGAPSPTNAVYMANTPNMDGWQRDYPATTLLAHNGAVGLPEGQMGNSEVGHLNIGAGRVVYQDFTRINLAIRQGDFFANPVLKEAMAKVKAGGSALHLLGLVSDGGVHSHIDHLKALVDMAVNREGLARVYIHAFMDGRDTPPKSGAGFLEELQAHLAADGAARIATVTGRYYAMDRDNRWERVQRAWKALVDGQGDHRATDPVAAVRAAYERGETDEFITPTVIEENGRPLATVADGDVVIFFNFRADRARQLTRAFTAPGFDQFPTGRRPALAGYVTFTRYDKSFDLPVVFPPQTLTHILGEEVSRHGLRQLRIAETEKYAHVTYFFNGGREQPFPLEDRDLVPSPKEVATYDQKPEMSAFQVTDELLARIRGNDYRFIVLNFANGDMVGHSGIFAAAVKACEAVDACLGRLVAAFREKGGIVIITADHGNAEIMFDPETNGPHTAHSLNPVPFILISDAHKGRHLRTDGALKDIAPTILTLMGLPIPAEMEGNCLIE